MKKVIKRKRLNKLEEAIRRKVFGMSYEEYKQRYLEEQLEFNKRNGWMWKAQYAKHIKMTTSEQINFYLKTIKTIFKDWEQDINDISIKNVGTCRIVSGYPYYSNNCKKPSCVLVESNGRN